MKIYTKSGDNGSTGLVWGTRVSKSDNRINACGSVDELNAWIGLLAEYTINEPYKPLLREIQDRLFTIGSNLMTEQNSKNDSKIPVLFDTDIQLIENEIDKMNLDLPPMTHFILPGGHKEVAFAHVARTVCRRAEREVVKLSETETQNPLIIIYLNRLSDYLFTLCRIMSKNLNVEEVKWTPRLTKN
ncbi:MAG: cob(I)yrinic acid a,c-diamide adenosyltransferase [Bacteroidota bacterium]|nr:cob(I)yrinic acid a,c-diamide adenosyltransferase [Bacteroidota bacterium]